MVKKDVILADFPENSFIPICNRVDGRLCPTSSMYFKNKYGRVGRDFFCIVSPKQLAGEYLFMEASEGREASPRMN